MESKTIRPLIILSCASGRGGGGLWGRWSVDHFWIILGPFSTILLTVLSTLCQWSCGLAHHFLEAKLLEQVNLHFWIIYNTHCWFNMLLCTCTMSHLCLEVTFLDHFCEHESVDHFFFET